VPTHLPFTELLAQLTNLGAAALIYGILVAIVALAAAFSNKPRRRTSALAVLQLLLPGRRRPPSSTSSDVARHTRSRRLLRPRRTHDVSAQQAA
jgi:hypothetical protein